MTTDAAADLLFWLGIGLGAVGITTILGLTILNIWWPIPWDETPPVPDVFPEEWAADDGELVV